MKQSIKKWLNALRSKPKEWPDMRNGVVIANEAPGLCSQCDTVYPASHLLPGRKCPRGHE